MNCFDGSPLIVGHWCTGYGTNDLLGSPTGVYVGCIWLEYGEMLAAAGNPAGAYMVTGNGLAFMSGRVSYTLGLIGPCVPTNTACSSSLVAYHLAAKGILLGDCTLATASGVNSLLIPTAASAAMTQVHALSPDGRCKAFGAEADGYGRGEGYTALIIEPAGRSSRPLALVAGSAVNQDGRSSGLTAPHGPSQQALISAAMREAGTAVLGYVASHGTGTPLGDPIETGALRKAVVAQGAATAGATFTIGAIKTLTGHLEGTAGLAGLLLAQTQLEQQYAHGLRYREINAYVANSFGGWAVPYRLPIQSAPSGKTSARLRIALCGMPSETARYFPFAVVEFAGTSSFGMSGVNAHAIIKEVTGTESLSAAPAVQATWASSKRCFVDVLVPLHPLLESAKKVMACFARNLRLSDHEILRMCSFPSCRQSRCCSSGSPLGAPIWHSSGTTGSRGRPSSRVQPTAR